jgi:hypothetical protein
MKRPDWLRRLYEHDGNVVWAYWALKVALADQCPVPSWCADALAPKLDEVMGLIWSGKVTDAAITGALGLKPEAGRSPLSKAGRAVLDLSLPWLVALMGREQAMNRVVRPPKQWRKHRDGYSYDGEDARAKKLDRSVARGRKLRRVIEGRARRKKA